VILNISNSKNWVDMFMRIPFGKYSILDVNMAHGIDACQGFMDNAMKNIKMSALMVLWTQRCKILQMIGQWIANPSAMGTAMHSKDQWELVKLHSLNMELVKF